MRRQKFTNPLDHIRIASPCPADWDQMIGTDRRRYCGECRLNVYNLSGMTREEAERLLHHAEGRLCVRYFRRADGSIITKDCPVGWRAIKRRVSKTAAAFASLIFAALGGIGLTGYFSQSDGAGGGYTVGVVAAEEEVIMGKMPYKESRPVLPEEKGEAVMGEVAYPEFETTGKIANFDRIKRQIIEEQN